MKKYELFSPELKQFIEDQYTTQYSTTKVIELVKERFDDNIGRGPIVDYLKSVGLYEGLNGPNYLKKKVEKQVEYLKNTYGVVNWGQMSDGGYKAQNKIPYQKLKLVEDLAVYKEQVEKLTKRAVQKLKQLNQIPTHCAYTGVEFADVRGQANPNDPRKRTVDHVVPVMQCYLLEWPPEKAASLDNIEFVLRVVNSIKGNTSFENFKEFVPIIKKALLNEGYQSN